MVTSDMHTDEPLKRAWWCLHCQRVFPRNEESPFAPTAGAPDPHFEVKPGVQGRRCPYHDCNGSPIDFWAWDDGQHDFVERYGAEPRMGVRYPLHDER